MVKSGLEKTILKFNGSLQRYLLTCQANSAFLGRFFCTGQQLWRPSWNFRIIFSRPLFTIIFKPKMVSNLRKNLCVLSGIKNLQSSVLTHELFNLINNIRNIDISKNWYFRNWNVIHRNAMFWFEICTIWTVIPVVNRKNWCESMPNIFRTENRLLQEWCEKRKYFWE